MTPPDLRRNWWPAVVIALALAVVYLAAAYFTGLWPFAQYEATLTPSVSTSPSSNPTTNWKTYTNKEFGYEFKYPVTIKLAASSDEGGVVPISDTASRVYAGPNVIAQDFSIEPIFIVEYSMFPLNVTADLVKKQFAEPARIIPVAISRFGLSGFKVSQDDYVVSNHYFLQTYTGYLLHLVVFNDLADQILSTFRFTK